MKNVSSSISKFFEKRNVRAGLIFALIAAMSGTITYFVMPRITQGDANGGYVDDDYVPPEMSSVDQFASKLTEATGVEGSLDLEITFPDKDGDDSTMNVVTIDDASLKVAMPSTGNLAFDFQGAIVYNDWSTENIEKATTHINLCDKDAYIDVWGAKIAYLDTEYKSLIGELISIFSDSIIKVPDELYDLLDKLSGDSEENEDEPSSSEDNSSLADTSMDWTIIEEGQTENKYKLDIGFADLTITLNLISDKDYNLKRVYIEDFKYEDITINLNFNASINNNAVEAIRDNVPSDYQNYTSLLNLKGILRKVGKAVAKERFNIDLDLNINHSDKDIDENIAVALDGNVNFGTKNYLANLTLANAADNTYAQNLNLAYITKDEDSNAYVNYNDITKASMNLITLEALLGRMENDGDSQDLSYLSSIFDFVFDSEVVKQVQKGRYDIIADEIEKVEVSTNKIILKLKMDKLGFGNDAIAIVTFDGMSNAPISKIELSDVKAKNFALDGTININTYEAFSFDTVGYYNMEHLPDIFDQVSDLVDTKQASLTLDGTILDEKNYGLEISGSTSFDANAKEGTGSAILSHKTENYIKNHLFAMDVDTKQAYFNYNDNDKREEYAGLNGLFSISNIQDLIEMIEDLTGEESFQKRFGGIFSSLEQDSATGIINDVINGKYASLVSSKILNKCDISTSGVDLVINGEVFSLENDIEVLIAFEDTTKPVTDENGEVTNKIIRNVKSVTLKDFVISSMTVNLTITLGKYDAKLSSLDKNLEYTDFSSVSTLAEYALNTMSKLNTYHLKSSMSVILWTADIITLDVDMYIDIEDEGTKIFGTLSNIPLIPAVNNDTWLFGDHGEDASFYREVSFYYDSTNVYVQGINPFGIFEAEDDDGNITEYDLTEIQNYKYETEYFKSTDNILHFLLKDVINMQDRLLKKIDTNGIALPESKEAMSTERLFDSFAYDKDDISWDLSLDLGALLNNDFLKNLDISFGGTGDKYLNSLSMDLVIFAGVKIEIIGNFQLENVGGNDFPKDSFNAYISKHQNDELSAK